MTEIAPEFVFASEREAAAKLRDAASAVGMKLHPLPYSRFDPDRSTWWLAPDPANPAFAFGKVVVERPTIVDDGAKLIGMHMEKGVGAKAALFFEETPRGRRLVMGRDWTWHPFHRALRSGELDEAIVQAEAAANGLPLVVEVVAAVAHPPTTDGDEDRPMDPDAVERIRYRFSGGELSVDERKTASRLSAFGDNEVMGSLGEKIAAIEDLDWTWVEVLIGVPFRPVTSGGLTATELWQRVCAPWTSWLR
jgi:hypothetical protein